MAVSTYAISVFTVNSVNSMKHWDKPWTPTRHSTFYLVCTRVDALVYLSLFLSNSPQDSDFGDEKTEKAKKK